MYMWSIVADRVVWSVGWSVCHISEPCKNGWTDPDAIWNLKSGGPKEACIRWESHWCHLANTIELFMCGRNVACCQITFTTYCYWGDGGGGHWLVQMEWRPVGWSVCLPLLISRCTIKSRSSLLAPAGPGGPRKRAIKWLCVCVCYYYLLLLLICTCCFGIGMECIWPV